jgi:hypothetical protein
MPKENPIITFLFPENKTLEDIHGENKDINEVINKSLFLENFGKIYSFGLLKMNLNIFFKNIINTKINGYHYNRISLISNELEIIKDNQNDITFYFLPCLNKINSILLLELNEKTKNLFIDNNNNVYELFTNYFNDNKTERDNSLKKERINIFIPSFNIQNHFKTEKVSEEINNIIILENKENNGEETSYIKIGSVDEFINVNLNKKGIEKQINYNLEINDNNEKENNKKNIVIKNDFILGIINNFSEIKFPIFQLIYVKKDFWIKDEEIIINESD